jgi:RimJ/RimL family protein N-acetyltransferase
MKRLSIEDSKSIHSYLMKDPYSHLFHLADLDEPYVENTRWFVRGEKGSIAALALLYTWPETPVLQLIEPNNPEAVPLLEDVLSALPPKVYCQISGGLAPILERAFKIDSLCAFNKMKWTGPRSKQRNLWDGDSPIRLTWKHEQAIRSFEPTPCFERRMLYEGFYYGIFDSERLVSMAGTPVLSKKYGVVIIGGVGTVESHRGRGLAARVMTVLVDRLKEQVSYIGLNVRSDNAVAIRCYEKCGFEKHAEHWECVGERR